MQLSDIDWFEWNGVKSTAYGMHVLTQPNFLSPLERAEYVTVPGRSGSLTILEGEDVYDDINLSCSCVIDDPFGSVTVSGKTGQRIPMIMGWLKGNGEVKFANRTDGYYKARIANQISFDKAVQGNPHRLVSVQFRCQPFFYLDSGKSPSDPYNKGSGSSTTVTLTNPGNIPSQPLIVLSHSNNAGGTNNKLICGDSTMEFDFTNHDYTKPVKVDCEAKIIYQGEKGNANDPLVLLGTISSGDWLTIPTGTAYFVFTGNISSVTITPRWRCI